MARILLDCDGVLADFAGHVHAVVSKAYPDALPPDRWTCWNFLRDHYTPEQRDLAGARLKSPEFWRDIPVVPGAQRAVQEFQRAGHDVHVVTSPWRGCREWADVRTEWVVRNMDVPITRVHVSADKSIYLGRVFIDDKPDHVSAWRAACEEYRHIHDVHGLLFDRPYNKHAVLPRVHGWTDQTVECLLLVLNPQPGVTVFW